MGVHPDLHDLERVATILLVIAVLVTSVRLYLRVKQGSLWWDDSFALLGIVSMSALTAGTFVLTNYANEARVAFYLLVTGYYVPIWSARLSILFTIIRFAPLSRQRKVLLSIAVFFGLQWALLMAQAIWTFQRTDPIWSSQAGRQPLSASITQVTTTVISSLLLIVLPVWIIRRVHLNPGLRLRLLSVFSLSVVTTLAAIAHFMTTDRMWVFVSGVTEVFVALSVCNAPVLVPALLRQFSDRATFVESQDHVVTTIGGSNRNRAGSTVVLNPRGQHETPNIVVHVVAAMKEDLESPNAKNRTDDD